MEQKNWHLVSVEQLKTILEQSKTPVLTVFYADWCGYCAQNVPAIKSYLSQNHKQLQWYLVDVTDPKVPVWEEENDRVWHLQLVPTTRIYHHQKIIFEHQNVISGQQLTAAISTHITK